MFTVEFNAKDVHPWIQERLEESVTTHTRVGVNSLKGQPAKNTDRSQLYFEIYSRKSFFSFQSFFSILIMYFSRLGWSELTSTLTYIMQANTNAYRAHSHNRTHTLFLIWPIKRCVFVKRDFFFCTWCRHRHTNTQQVQCWVKLWRAKPKNNETRKVSPCQTATVLLKFIVSYINNATLFHSNRFFFFLLKKR